MLSLTVYGHLITKPSRQQQNCHQEVSLPPMNNSEAIDTILIPSIGYLHFTFSLSLFKFEVNPNTNLLILIKYWRFLCPTTDALTALFISTWILKFKSQLMFAFFTAVNPLSRPLTKQKFTPTSSNERSWLVICEWQILIHLVCFPVSRFIAYDHNYDWRQLKTHLW